MIIPYINLIKNSIPLESAQTHLQDIIYFIKVAKHNSKFCLDFIDYFLYRLCLYNHEFPKSDIEEILKQVCLSEYELNHQHIVETINSFQVINSEEHFVIYRNKLEKIFPFLKLRRDRETGNLFDDNAHLNRQALKDYLRDVFKLCNIEKQIAFWNGYGYSLGEKLQGLLSRLFDTFNIIGLKLSETVYQELLDIPLYNNVPFVSHYLIPCLDKVIVIDKDHLDFEHLRIENHVTSKPTVNPLQISLGDLDIKDIEKAFYDEETDRNFDLWSDNDKEVRANMEETLGLIIIHSSGALFRKAVYFHAPIQRTGKTTFCKCIWLLVGSEHTSKLNFTDLLSKNSRFNTSDLIGKRLNWGDETPQGAILDTETIGLYKVLYNCGEFKPDIKYVHVKDTSICSPTFIYSCNYMPYFHDCAFEDRLLVIPFTHFFGEGGSEYEITERILKYFFLMGLHGALRILNRLKNNEYAFTYSVRGEQHRKEIKQKNDPLYRYIIEHEDSLRAYDNEYLKEPVKERSYKSTYLVDTHFQNFKDYCSEGNYFKGTKTITKGTFIERVCEELKMKCIKGNFRNCLNSATAKENRALQGQVFTSL